RLSLAASRPDRGDHQRVAELAGLVPDYLIVNARVVYFADFLIRPEGDASADSAGEPLAALQHMLVQAAARRAQLAQRIAGVMRGMWPRVDPVLLEPDQIEQTVRSRLGEVVWDPAHQDKEKLAALVGLAPQLLVAHARVQKVQA